ncbi:MAG: hypothetical protein ABI779_19560 [Acidobacteriota bacterium]
MTLGWSHRIYFAAVGLLALRVGFVGYFNPGDVVRVIPWQVPPLHARFLGAMYISGLVFMIGAMLVRRWSEVRVVVPMIAIWTGMLFVVSLLHLDEFDYSRLQVWIWFGAYFVYPLIAVWLTWLYRGDTSHPQPSAPLSGWARNYLNVQGIVVTVLALALLVAPGAMIPLWPWKATPLLLQIYASPFLSYGLGSLMLARQRVWAEVRVGVVATFFFAALVLAASLIHRPLFSMSENPDRLWFTGFGIATAMLALLSIRAQRAH